ncbi:hypothetical protein GCM10010421_10080 [Streptomyces glaucus]|uniref:Uncharacterized protein n=2 Tax=Streptomyces glaucus TaxID=284029 RepID=A0ABN3JB08_9ACTN
MAVFGGPPARGSQALLPRDVVVGPHHAQHVHLLDAVLVHVAAGVEAAGVGDPLPEREPDERGRPALGSGRPVAVAGHAVRERQLRTAVLTGVDDDGLHAAPPVLVPGADHARVDERGQGGGVA